VSIHFTILLEIHSAPGNLQPFDMDTGSVIPDLIRDRGDGRRGEHGPRVESGMTGAEGTGFVARGEGEKWTQGQARGDGLLKDTGSESGVTGEEENMDPGSSPG
jgi:hypothetical protein